MADARPHHSSFHNRFIFNACLGYRLIMAGAFKENPVPRRRVLDSFFLLFTFLPSHYLRCAYCNRLS